MGKGRGCRADRRFPASRMRLNAIGNGRPHDKATLARFDKKPHSGIPTIEERRLIEMTEKKTYRCPDVQMYFFTNEDNIATEDIISTSVPNDPFDHEISGFGDVFVIPR